MADRARRYERALRLRSGITDTARRLVADGPTRVQAGPFAGMCYPADRVADIDMPAGKLLGTYEREIAHVFAAAIRQPVRMFVDVGCADGYYAVGMAYATPDLTTYAFDLSRTARQLCLEVARVNALENRVRIGNRFTPRALDQLGAEGALVLCDIEGGERGLFDLHLVRRLAKSTVVIEVHEDAVPGTSDALRSVFAASHTVLEVRPESRERIADLPPLALEESRPPAMHWLIFEPR